MTHESPAALKNKLFSIISEMQSVSHLFVKQPEKDFSRSRKISFSDTIHFLLSMKGNTLRKEWLDFWEFSPEMPSVSACLHVMALICPLPTIQMIKPPIGDTILWSERKRDTISFI
uniref:hypothetical protein n=1 Tax=Acetatifactor sp. TaxID=1872090 RepID=UPI004057B7BE